MEVNTKITQSDREINTSDIEPEETSAIVKLSQLLSTLNFQRVTVNIEVVEVKSPLYVNTPEPKLKQDLIIADDTGNAKATIWEKSVNSLELQF